MKRRLSGSPCVSFGGVSLFLVLLEQVDGFTSSSFIFFVFSEMSWVRDVNDGCKQRACQWGVGSFVYCERSMRSTLLLGQSAGDVS